MYVSPSEAGVSYWSKAENRYNWQREKECVSKITIQSRLLIHV